MAAWLSLTQLNSAWLSLTQLLQNNNKNSKVFEQKGDLLNFKANIDPMAVRSQVKPVWAE